MFFLQAPAAPGTVYLVGAGPGDPDLITVRALKLLRQADVILYDALACPQLLDESRVGAERINVGKRAGQHSYSQDEINGLLWQKAQNAQTVVRLKGGDPFVFGRGGEEMMYLRARGVPVEIVPGVTSAIAAAAAVQVPVTQRGVSNRFAVVTGHSAAGGDQPDWAALAAMDTLVVMMGLNHIDVITDHLLAAGRAGSTPAMAVQSATTAQQRAVTATLETLAVAVAEAGLATPATLLIGDVVTLAAPARVAAWPNAAVNGAHALHAPHSPVDLFDDLFDDLFVPSALGGIELAVPAR